MPEQHSSNSKISNNSVNEDCRVDSPASLSELRPVGTDKLRAIKKRLLFEAIERYGGYEKVPQEQRRRLERQSIVLGEKGFDDEWGTRSSLSFYALLSRNKDELGGKKYYRVERLLLREACRANRLTADETLAVTKVCSGDRYLLQKATAIFLCDRKVVGDDTWKFYHGSWADNIRQGLIRARRPIVCDFHADTHAPWSEAFRILDSFGRRLAVMRQPPTFEVSRCFAKVSIQVEPGFEWLAKRFAGIDLTQMMERLPLIPRKHFWGDTIRALSTIPYDGSRVRVLSIDEPGLGAMKFVTKRLFPIKSAFAEDEYRNSKLLYDLGLPLPEPVGIVRHDGNQYFIWRCLDVQPPSGGPHYSAQCSALEKLVTDLGITNFDWAERNFVPSMRDGTVQPHIVDCERIYIPPDTRRRLNGVVRSGIKIHAPEIRPQ